MTEQYSYELPLQRIEAMVQERPNDPWLHEQIGDEWVTYSVAETFRQIKVIAAAMHAQGWQAGDKIAIIGKNSPQWLISDYAMMAAGLISVPIYATAGVGTIEYVLEHSGAKAVYIGKVEGTDALETANIDIPVIAYPDYNLPTRTADFKWHDWLESHQEISHVNTGTAHETATIVYTSGSTGRPKGVVLSYENLAAGAKDMVDALEDTGPSRMLSYLPMAHITERSCVTLASVYGPVEIFFNGGLNTFAADLQHAKPTNFLSVPRLWAKFQAQILAAIPDEQLQAMLDSEDGEAIALGIRTKLGLENGVQFGSGSAPIAPGLLRWFSRIGIDICEGWGMSETSGASCSNAPFIKEQLGTIGRPVGNVQMKLSDADEILIKGPSIFKEYYNNPEVTAESFVDGWFRTGDKARINEDGSYSIIGRVKEQFKTAKGKYVAPVPIESLLGSISYVEQVCVLGLGRAQPMAILVLAEVPGEDRASLAAKLESEMDTINAGLEPHCRLNHMLVSAEPWTIENGMLTPTLKLKRDQIEAQFANFIGDEFSAKIAWQS